MSKTPEPPILLEGKEKRLKSLDEFERPYWLGLFQPGENRRKIPFAAVVAGLFLGVWLGVFLFT